MTTFRHNNEKFSCTTSRFLTPTFRRPGYREIIKINSLCDPEEIVCSKWSDEDENYYQLINTALLDDNYEVLKKHARFINSLRMAIKNNHSNEIIIVYRGLSIDSKQVNEEYKIGSQFLWPTFTSTSRNKDVADGFGDYIFEIHAAEHDWTYRSDISKYSACPEEEEVLFYPYSGFVVQNIIKDAKIIQLQCIDTLAVESSCAESIPHCVKMFDRSRNLYVYFYKDSNDICLSWGSQPNRMFLIAENTNGYWDAPYRYHHCNGYFLKTGNNQWKEYQNNKLFANFQTVNDDDEYKATTLEYDNLSNENWPLYRPVNDSKNRVKTAPCDVGAD